jgi:hypothetical protein
MVASQNRRFDAGVSLFKLNDGSTLRDLSPYIIDFAGLPGEKKVNDGTTWGSVGKRPSVSIQENKITVKLLFNMVTDVGAYTVLEKIWDATADTPVAFEYYPAGSGTVGNAKITGNAFLTVFKIASSMGNDVLINAEMEVDNGVTTGVVT